MNEPETISWLRLLIAFGVVATLLAGLGFVLKIISRRGFSFAGLARPTEKRRMELVESIQLDMRRRLVIVRCDEQEHLLLLGAERDIVVKANLSPLTNPPKASSTSVS